jgi:hypothetical protein
MVLVTRFMFIRTIRHLINVDKKEAEVYYPWVSCKLCAVLIYQCQLSAYTDVGPVTQFLLRNPVQNILCTKLAHMFDFTRIYCSINS